jgi:type I site-specific restriction-modification system R (restriction) subunit
MERLRVVDWKHPANNDFLLVSQFSVTGALSAISAFILQHSSLPLVWWSSS